MNMRWQVMRVVSRAAGVLLLCPVAWAQSAPPPPPGPDTMFFAGGGPMPAGHEPGLGFVEFEGGLGGAVVKASPFSAQTSVETTQTLPDGNVINRKTAGAMYRDNQGRTRREQTVPEIGPFAASGKVPHAVFINDSVAGVHYVLEEDRKVARKFSPLNRSELGPRADAKGPGGRPERNLEETTESLGTQTVNGVVAQGTRVTRTIPAGKIGNEKPIQIVTEKWYSPDLQTTVMVKHSDPRSGTLVFQLQNISRAEPAASLFQVPSDYAVKEGGPGPEGHGFRHGPPAPPASATQPD